GGHADGDPNVLQVALREGVEESGIEGLSADTGEVFDVDVHLIPARKADPKHFHFDVRFVLVAPPEAQYVVSEESHDLAWVRPENRSQYSVDASVERLFLKTWP
ncbi:MAG: NUDIX hydrolase, partial [Myxococcota bacterium]